MHLAGISNGYILVSGELIDERAFASTSQAHDQNEQLSRLHVVHVSRSHGFVEFARSRHLQ